MIRTTLAIFGVATVAASVLAGRSLPDTRQARGAIAFEHVTVVPMDRERTLANHTVVVQGGVITAVGRDGEVTIPSGAARIDLRGRYVMPGLADMHVHLYDTDQFINYLAHGITTIGVLHGAPPVLRWRRQVERGELLGPTIYTAGPTLDGAPALNSAFLSLGSPENARIAVRALAEAGYDFLKVYSGLPPETYDAIISEANSRHIAAVGHIPFRVGVDGVLKPNGQAMIAHAEEFFRGPVDSARMAEMVQLVKRTGVTVTPNMLAYVDYIRSIDDLPRVLADPEMRFVSAAAFSEKLPSHNRSIRQNPQAFRAALVNGLGQFRRFTKQLSEAQVPLLVGTDTEIFGTAGASAHEELTEMASAGLTPYQVLVAGTRTAGEFVASRVRKTERFGTVAVGQRADLLVLSANPLASVENTNRIDGVMVRGRWLPASRLAAMRDSLALIRARQKPLVARFDSLMTAGKLDDAERALSELRRVNAGSAPIAQGVLWVKAQRALQRDTLAALRVLRWEAEMFPESHSSHAELARVYALRSDTARAVAEARRALTIFPKHEPALRVLEQFGKRD
jgi:hypothetical protein